MIASPSSKDWLKPGDADWPCTVYKTDAAFEKRWRELEQAGYKLVRFESSRPKKQKRKEKYTVKVPSKNDPLLSAFAAWLKTQVYGSVGYFEFITQKIPKRITTDAALVRSGRSFIRLPDGSLVVAAADGKIKVLDSDGGKPKAMANDLRAFLTKLAGGRTGVDELDDKDATGRKTLAEWLAEQAWRGDAHDVRSISGPARISGTWSGTTAHSTCRR